MQRDATRCKPKLLTNWKRTEENLKAMSEKLKESLSAVIDGEADEFELRRVLDEMSRDEHLAGSWERYHVIGSVLRGQRASVSVAMRDRVWTELQSSPDETENLAELDIVAAERPAAAISRPKWVPVAVAATVALAVVVGFIGFQGGEQVVPEVAETTEPVSAEQLSLYEAVALNTEVTDLDQNRTEAYIVRHYQQIGMDRPGGLGFARMVAYERD